MNRASAEFFLINDFILKWHLNFPKNLQGHGETKFSLDPLFTVLLGAAQTAQLRRIKTSIQHSSPEPVTRKQLDRSSGLAGGKSTTETYTGSCTTSKLI